MYDNFDFNFPEIENEPIVNFLEEIILEKYYYKKSLVVYDKIETAITKHISENVLYQYRRVYVRENKSNCCPTLTANMGGGGHNVPLLKDDIGIRKLTPRECFNLQGFNRDYKLPDISDSGLYRLAGNAVSIPVIRLIIDKINKLCIIDNKHS
jgi:DNA (cytosine-5)-methyltransferase 1